jgi:hypothetical protein
LHAPFILYLFNNWSYILKIFYESF